MTLLARAGCPASSAVADYLRRLDVPFHTVRLEEAADGDTCGFVSPTLQVRASRRPTLWLVQPTEAEVADALASAGVRRRILAAERA